MWIIAPDRDSLTKRWKRLTSETNLETKEVLFHPHFRGGDLGDRYLAKVVHDGLYGHEHRSISVANDTGAIVKPIRYGFRSFNRQWIIPDNRLINQPNPTLWSIWSEKQLFLTALTRAAPTSGPALTFTALIPDYDHYRGSFGGRVFPLWMDTAADTPNVRSEVITKLTDIYGTPVSAADIMAYIAAIAAHPAYIARFAPHLVQPGLRIPITADPLLFADTLLLGREVVWLHTFGERFVSPSEGRPPRAPRLPEGQRPQIPAAGSIPSAADAMPNSISYHAATRRLHIGSGFVDNVPPEVWSYEISGKNVITQWFSYRSRDRRRPVIGDRRPPSPLEQIQPDAWHAEYTTELLNVLNVLGRLVMLEPTGTAVQPRKMSVAACSIRWPTTTRWP
jgi:hypothetical protein